MIVYSFDKTGLSHFAVLTKKECPENLMKTFNMVKSKFSCEDCESPPSNREDIEIIFDSICKVAGCHGYDVDVIQIDEVIE